MTSINSDPNKEPSTTAEELAQAQATAYAEPNQSKDCPRCGDLFYHPKTLIEDQRQRAKEWEDVAKAKDAEITALKAEVEAAKVCPNEEWECVKIQRRLEAELTRLQERLAIIQAKLAESERKAAEEFARGRLHECQEQLWKHTEADSPAAVYWAEKVSDIQALIVTRASPSPPQREEAGLGEGGQ